MSGLHEITLVILPVSDQAASVDFYVNKLGLEKRTDVEFGHGMRWIEVYAPESSTGISLAIPPEGREVTGQETGITFRTDDIDEEHARLSAAGVDVDTEIMRMGGMVPDMFWFRDPDGHRLLVVKPTAPE
jgi:catechol 2,3-dioxygenase-like lactoylglutathione lyase family enzyme